MKQITLCLAALLVVSFNLKAQEKLKDSITYPYVLPIWGQKAADKGFADQLQLPFGINANYVNVYMDLEITEFDLRIGGKDFSDVLNVETLNFTQVSATSNGINLRADAWILPFMNVYGLFSAVRGGTQVTLQPTWKDATGEVILQLPQFSSNVEFNANTYGLGTTLIFGWNGYFLSTDFNYSRTDTDLLKDQVGYATLSARGGYRFGLSKKRKDFFLAPYAGVMYRNFIGAKGSEGNIGLDEVFPDLNDTFNQRVDDKVASNEAIIKAPETGTAEKIKLQAQNQALHTIKDKVNESGLFTTEVDYRIKKELIQTVTFQMGFNLQINKHWMFRGEYSLSDAQRFIMTGLQYRFGVKKKGMK
ncbi:autotransporter outer membrane beta-barrel domain-containing protein [Tamlana haliotis]|uniref:Autotransporter outer membrane beta-barrel domain-containing protein n=1 Tax=Pseudotamlana haliotis TaxID=2614804 RepID=A0A6N6MJN0_9FLAO|nr:autotransporter outer membrane beta-barrel domain-containing protein [Tamlana haliotis]KAB1069807.1 autotransporter outer membrane beta-barrel domain-containing protein [Tamlana haliotis]